MSNLGFVYKNATTSNRLRKKTDDLGEKSVNSLEINSEKQNELNEFSLKPDLKVESHLNSENNNNSAKTFHSLAKGCSSNNSKIDYWKKYQNTKVINSARRSTQLDNTVKLDEIPNNNTLDYESSECDNSSNQFETPISLSQINENRTFSRPQSRNTSISNQNNSTELNMFEKDLNTYKSNVNLRQQIFNEEKPLIDCLSVKNETVIQPIYYNATQKFNHTIRPKSALVTWKKSANEFKTNYELNTIKNTDILNEFNDKQQDFKKTLNNTLDIVNNNSFIITDLKSAIPISSSNLYDLKNQSLKKNKSSSHEIRNAHKITSVFEDDLDDNWTFWKISDELKLKKIGNYKNDKNKRKLSYSSTNELHLSTDTSEVMYESMELSDEDDDDNEFDDDDESEEENNDNNLNNETELLNNNVNEIKVSQELTNAINDWGSYHDFIMRNNNNEIENNNENNNNTKQTNNIIKENEIPEYISSVHNIDESLYFGETAKIKFFGQYRLLKLKLLKTISINNYSKIKTNYELLSPRTRFLTKFIEISTDKTPLPIIIRPNFEENEINLSNMLLNDEYILLLSECIKDLPKLTKINLCNNQLSDEVSYSFFNQTTICNLLKNIYLIIYILSLHFLISNYSFS